MSDLGSGIAPIALAFGVLGLPGADAGDLGLVLLRAAVPRVVFMLVGGVVADRLDRGRVMVLAEVLAGLAQLLAGVLLLTGLGHGRRGCARWPSSTGTAFSLFYPAYAGLVPSLVADPADLQSTNALLRLSTNIAGHPRHGPGRPPRRHHRLGLGPGRRLADLRPLGRPASGRSVNAPGGREESSTSALTDLREGWREFTRPPLGVGRRPAVLRS